jgi:hypothetical protein
MVTSPDFFFALCAYRFLKSVEEKTVSEKFNLANLINETIIRATPKKHFFNLALKHSTGKLFHSSFFMHRQAEKIDTVRNKK